jgi:HEAT repeat protein
MRAPSAFVHELADVGVSVESPWELVNSRRSYRSAVPVLIEWLERAEVDVPAAERARFREGLVRSLSVKEARGVAGPALVREFRRPGMPADYRWAVGNALEVVADDSIFEDLVALVRERAFGRDRQMVVLSLARVKDPRAVEVLVELLDDEDVVGHAVMALGRLKARRARPAIERCLDDPRPWVRKEAKKALVKIGG